MNQPGCGRWWRLILHWPETILLFSGFLKECSDQGILKPEHELVCSIEVEQIEVNG